MSQTAQITDAGYQPAPDLAEALAGFERRVSVDYGEQTTTDLPGDLTAQREQYRAYIDDPGRGVDGTRTITGFGMVISLSGHLGFASAQLLANARVFGDPTLCYMDDAPPPSGWGERYQDVTAEWYRPTAVDAGIPAARRATRPEDFDADDVSVAELEEWTRLYLGEK